MVDSDSEFEYDLEYEPEEVEVGDETVLRVWTVVPPPIEYISSLHAQRQEISGRQVWTGSLALAQFVTKSHQNRLNNSAVELNLDHLLSVKKKILELGSGTGILGMAIHKLSPHCTIALTDGDPKALDLLAKNLAEERNLIDRNRVKARLLRWGLDSEKDDSDSDTGLFSFRRWCQTSWPDVFGEEQGDNISNKEKGEIVLCYRCSFDLILAGDVLYKAELPRLFFETAYELLDHDTGDLLLCHVPRASVTQAIVQTAAKTAGFQTISVLADWQREVGPISCPMEDISRACIYHMKKR